MVGQNLFLIGFELADDLELILEGRPWFFRNSVILFDRLCQAMDRNQIRLTSSPYWMKIDSISPEFDKKDLMHTIGPRLAGFSDLKLMKILVGSKLIWMSRDHSEEVGAQCSYTEGEKAAQISTVEVAGDNNEMGVTGIWGIARRMGDEWGGEGADEAQKG
ncbi:hypothetical protein GOBAR_DD07614 [Gossypium barbadense]|nr:hypothetical protein GOBAR_DD07614 [Gossypium barbadense]